MKIYEPHYSAESTQIVDEFVAASNRQRAARVAAGTADISDLMLPHEWQDFQRLRDPGAEEQYQEVILLRIASEDAELASEQLSATQRAEEELECEIASQRLANLTQARQEKAASKQRQREEKRKARRLDPRTHKAPKPAAVVIAEAGGVKVLASVTEKPRRRVRQIVLCQEIPLCEGENCTNHQDEWS